MKKIILLCSLSVGFYTCLEAVDYTYSDLLDLTEADKKAMFEEHLRSLSLEQLVTIKKLCKLVCETSRNIDAHEMYRQYSGFEQECEKFRTYYNQLKDAVGLREEEKWQGIKWPITDMQYVDFVESVIKEIAKEHLAHNK